jgi:hypothetical protein
MGRHHREKLAFQSFFFAKLAFFSQFMNQSSLL